MLKSQVEVLADLKALHLSASCTIKNPAVLNGHTLALLTLATQWEVREQFINFIKAQIDKHYLLEKRP